MKKGIFIFALFFAVSDLMAAQYMPKKFNTVTSHDDVYPYVLNNTKQNKTNTKRPQVSSNITSNQMMNRKKVVQRKNNNVRAATTSAAYSSSPATTNPSRRVVQRTNTTTARAGTNTRTNSGGTLPTKNNSARASVAPKARATTQRTTTTNYSSNERVSSQRCLADYKECMEMYCKREDTAYNRCYCSAKLAQIDAKYQNQIDELIQKIVRLQYSVSVDSDEIKEYWDKTVGSFTGSNPWVNIDNALNIEWADTQSRIRGQNAFNTGHQYCVKHLNGCYYMATNLRDSYKSEIARDCESYEKSLQKIKEAAESVIESYE